MGGGLEVGLFVVPLPTMTVSCGMRGPFPFIVCGRTVDTDGGVSIS